MKNILLSLLVMTFWVTTSGQSLKHKDILFYTSNGKGYIHNNIPAAVNCFDSLSKVYGFNLVKSAEPEIFTQSRLQDFDLIIFASTNNDVFDTDAQRLAFRHYIEAGGKFFGIHSVMGTERNWTWFKQMLGGTFAWHPKFRPFDLVKMDASHPTLSVLPDLWTKEDECYFAKELYPGITGLLSVDLESLHPDTTDLKRIILNKGTYDRYYPISWEQNYDGGAIYITTLGHAISDYQGGTFVNYLVDCMKYMIGKKQKKDFSKAYATNIQDAVKQY